MKSLLKFDSNVAKVGMFIMLLAILCAGGALYGLLREFRLDSSDKIIQAVVTDKTFNSSHHTNSPTRRAPHRKIYYEFTLGDALIKDYGDVPLAAWEQLKAGSQVTVKYLENDPAVNRIEMEGVAAKRKENFWALLCASGFVLILGSVFIVVPYLDMKSKMRGDSSFPRV